MAKRFKVTGMARFLVFLLIAAPLIYSGVSIFNGENPLESAKRDFGIDLQKKSPEKTNDTYSTEKVKSEDGLLEYLKEENQKKDDQINRLKEELRDCQSQK